MTVHPSMPSPGRHEAAVRRRWFAAAQVDTILSFLAVVAIVVVVAVTVLARGDRPAAAAEPSAACRRATDAAERLITAGEQRLIADGRIDGRALADPHLTSLYATWRRESRTCKAGQ